MVFKIGEKKSPQEKERISKMAKLAWANPEIRAKRIKAGKVARARTGASERMSLATKEAWRRPGLKEKKSKTSKEVWARPEVKEKMHRAVSGPNNSQWRDGISFLPYCPQFDEKIKEEIRRAFGFKCYLCPTLQKKRKLHIHHIDFNKNTLCNGRRWPLLPLCSKCHGKTNHSRWYWFNLLINYWAMNPEISFISESYLFSLSISA